MFPKVKDAGDMSTRAARAAGEEGVRRVRLCEVRGEKFGVKTAQQAGARDLHLDHAEQWRGGMW